MTIEQLDDSKILITLCSEDMENFELQFGKMSFCNEHSKRVLLRLLRLACMKAGVSYRSKTVLMEALPHQSGCLILVTMMERKQRKTYKVKRITTQVCFMFLSAEDMLCAVENLYSQSATLRSNSLWLCEGRYYLIFDYPLVQERVKRIAGEYSAQQEGTRIKIARIKEQGKLLCAENAVDTIGRRISAK